MVYFAVGAILGYVAYVALVFQPGSELGANARKLARAVPFVVAAALLLAGAVGVLREPGRWVELVLDHAEILLVGMVFGFIAGYAYENVFIPLARGAMNPTVNSMHHSSVAMVWGGILGAILIVGLLAPKLDDIFHIKTPFLELELDTKKSVSQGAALRLGRLENDWKTVTAPLFLYSYPKAIAREALLLDEVKSKRPTRDLAEWADTCVNKGARDNLEFMQNVASLASKFGVDDLLTQIAGKDRAAVGAKIRPVARAMDKLFFTAENQSAIGRPPVITEAEKKEEIDLNDIANAVALYRSLQSKLGAQLSGDADAIKAGSSLPSLAVSDIEPTVTRFDFETTAWQAGQGWLGWPCLTPPRRRCLRCCRPWPAGNLCYRKHISTGAAAAAAVAAAALLRSFD